MRSGDNQPPDDMPYTARRRSYAEVPTVRHENRGALVGTAARTALINDYFSHR